MRAQGLPSVPDGTLCCDECWRLGYVSPLGAYGIRSGELGWLCRLCQQLLEPFVARFGTSADPGWHMASTGSWNAYWLDLHTDWLVEQRMARQRLGLS